MFCDEIIELIEPMASGDLTPDARVRAHLAECANCAAALESARRIEGLLKVRPASAPPSQFTARTLARIRRERWRHEQWVDVAFNLGIGAVACLVAAAAWFVLMQSGAAAIGVETVRLVANAGAGVSGELTRALPLYAGATALLAAVLGLWWWAERPTA